jgi:hypothetical protein
MKKNNEKEIDPYYESIKKVNEQIKKPKSSLKIV